MHCSGRKVLAVTAAVHVAFLIFRYHEVLSSHLNTISRPKKEQMEWFVPTVAPERMVSFDKVKPIDFKEVSDVLRPYFRKSDGNIDIYTFSAVISELPNVTNGTRSFSHAIHLSSWEHALYMNDSLKCCYVWNDGHISEAIGLTKSYPFKSPRNGFKAVLYRCFVNDPQGLDGCYVITKTGNCLDMRSRALKPLLPVPAGNESIGLCLKIVFGQHVDPKHLVDWFEYYKEMKVDTVIVKTLNVSTVVQRVLDYYARDGYANVMPFDIPMRRGAWNPKGSEIFAHERVAMMDCQARLRHHTYFTILDLDEFLYLYQHSDMKEAIKNLRALYPSEHGFIFKTELYLKEWGDTVSNDGSIITRYFQRQDPITNRPKYVAIRSFMLDGKLNSHNFNLGQRGNRIHKVSSDIAVLKHYRKCYKDMLAFCKGTRIMDTSILTVVRRFQDRRDKVLKELSIQ